MFGVLKPPWSFASVQALVALEEEEEAPPEDDEPPDDDEAKVLKFVALFQKEYNIFKNIGFTVWTQIALKRTSLNVAIDSELRLA